ncbi:nitroreductase family protein [Hoeflea marina]|uniref:Nitroreductase family protein n=1 Tax=Hoeflea marina TaxID=274592 RepID=A0A317PHR3_9HYPH|nr:nitroreductase family protein [Hoeflea marina]PWV98930.1 nitroreductase family protein [Hoeflea marina]
MVTRRTIILGAAAAAVTGAAAYALQASPAYEDLAESVWVPRHPSADPDLAYLVHYATLAANSHNTQPWLFERSGRVIRIRPDMARQTPVVDPDDHHLYASLGCAGENLALAAMAAGKAAGIVFRDGPEAAVEIDVSASATSQPPLFDAILRRQCTRSDYDGRAVSGDDLEKLRAAARVEGAELIVMTDRTLIEQALEMIVAANAAQVADPRFVAELKSWIRFNARQAGSHRDGLFSGCTGNPELPAWLGGLAFELVLRTGADNDKLARQIRSSAGLAVIVTERNDRAHWVQSGRSCQRLALQATALGISHAFVNQPVEVADHRRAFARWLGIGDRRPDLVLRYGYGQPMPRSLRRPVEDVIV